MIEKIVMINGKVNYSITLDPSVWIFDDRKIDIDTYFYTEKKEKNELEEYTKEVSSHWDREIREGAILPPTIGTEKKYMKEKVISGSFAIPFRPFLTNAAPLEDATKLIVVTEDNQIEMGIDTAFNLIIGFSKNGKPLSEDGPIHVYFGDGSNLDAPIKYVKEFRIE
ncbi:peptidyl-prolyl cis-trans isomerase [Neobacillus sp. D3-1R]|uniref:peptidyl-prolyl cis-trans isomerase n=1 Tax=Neobacillus sp. D3-1R TaxID=3445778 RepID=UPI003FA0C4A7